MKLAGIENRIRRIALLRALKTARVVMEVLLVVSVVYLTFIRRSVSAPLLSALFAAIAPALIGAMRDALKGRYGKAGGSKTKGINGKDREDVLPALSEKYGYSDYAYENARAAFVVSLGLLCAWQYGTLQSGTRLDDICPAAVITVSVLTYIVRGAVLAGRLRKELLEGKT